ncbi:MAG: cell division protein ZapA [Saccharofermentans sp.]|nr:cell division protein ZapA [Saccharofermentans sp.]
MKKSSQSLMSKYSDGSIKKKKASSQKDMPLMTTYEQRFKGSLSKEVTVEKKLTLDEKIEKREKQLHPDTPSNNDDLMPKRVSVEIAGNRYLMGCTSEMSETRIRRIASMVNSILSEAKEDNPGLTNSRVTTLALIDACDKLVAAQDELSNLKTEVMYFQQKASLEKGAHVPSEPTPMEQLAMGTTPTTEK